MEIICKLSATVLFFVIGFGCDLSHAISAELNSKLVQLHASSAVKDGSTAYYDPDIATWVLNLTLRIPKLGSTSSSTSKIMFRVDLALPNETELKRNSIFASCRNSSLHFVGDCRERNVHTKYFSQSKDEAEEQLQVTFDHVYSGCYKLKVYCCTRRTSCGDCYGRRHWVSDYDLGRVETNLENVKMNRMNISIRLSPDDWNAELEFKINYFMESYQKFIPFKEFEVEIKSIADITKNVSQRLIRRFLTDRTEISFPYCINSSVTCSADDRFNNDEIDDVDCNCLRDGIYKVTISPRDSRCNHPFVCNSYRQPCKRFIVTNFLGQRNGPSLVGIIIRKYSSTVIYVLTPIALVMCILLIALASYKRRQLATRHKSDFLMKQEETMIPTSSFTTVRVLMIYDIQDSLIRCRASTLRAQLIACGATVVYDAGDPEQEESINVKGETLWFSEYIDEPDIRIVVIQSHGMMKCQQELISSRIADTAQEPNDKLLRFLINQLIALAASKGNNLYGRIFRTTFDPECTSNSYLTPFRCFLLPEHFNSLINQLLVDDAHITSQTMVMSDCDGTTSGS